MRELSRRIVLGIAWLVAAALLAFGAAGIVAGMDHVPGPGRPELTYAGDSAVAPALDRAARELAEIAAQVESLGAMGRRALSAMVTGDEALLDALIADGGGAASAIEDRARILRRELSTLPLLGSGTELRIGAEVRARHARLIEALDATSALEESWAVLTGGSLAATRMTALLEGHDAAAFAATEAGRAGAYDLALSRLDEAEARIAAASELRDRLADTIDTTTLDEWLRRNSAYDAALRRLYVALRDVGDRVTQEVRDAVAAEQAAREQLPEDSSGLIIIVAEIGRGGANQAVIDIEKARAILAASLEGVAE